MKRTLTKCIRSMALVMATLSCGLSGVTLADSQLPESTALSADEAFMLVSVKDRSPRLSSLALTNNQEKLKLNLEPRNNLQLIKVKAGTYTARQQKFGKQKGLVVTPGTVTYIGDWTLLGQQSIRVNGKLINASLEKHRIQYDVEKLRAFSQQNAWIKKYPLTISNKDGTRVINQWSFEEENS